MESGLNFPRLDVDHFEDRGVHVVTLSGELDLASVGEMEAALGAASSSEQPRVCLDLTELDFIDSTGLAAVIRTHLAIEETGGSLAVVCSDNPVRRTVQTTGLLEMLMVTDTREAGLLALERHG